MKRFVPIFWACVIAAPALATLVAIAQFPPGVDVPLHWNASGQIDDWGSPWVMFPLSMIMSGTNALTGLCCRYSDKLYDMGLIHGISRKNARPTLCGIAVVIALVMIGILVWWVATAKAAML